MAGLSIRTPYRAKWREQDEYAVDVMFNDTALDMVDPWQWPLYRGAKARPVALIQKVGKKDVWKTTNFSGNTITVKTPQTGGIKPAMSTLTIKEVYLDHVEPVDDETIAIRLYDSRLQFRGKLWAFDINVRLPDGNYKDGTAKSATEAWTFEDVLSRLAASSSTSFTIDASADSINYLKNAAPDNLQWAGVLSLADGIDRLLAQTPLDMTVDIDGRLMLVDSTSTTFDSTQYGWQFEPNQDTDITRNNGAPKTIEVLFDERHEFRLQVPDLFASRVQDEVAAQQVYFYANKYLSLADLLLEYTTAVRNFANDLGQQVPSQRLIPTLSVDCDKYLFSSTWKGTPLQLAANDPKNAVEVQAAKLAAEIVRVIQRDHRSLIKLDIEDEDQWANIEFGLLNENGGIVSAREVRERTGKDANGNDVFQTVLRSAIEGPFVTLLQRPADPQSLANGQGFVPFAIQSEGAIPLKAVWDRDPQHRVVRLVQDSTKTNQGDRIIAGRLSVTPGVQQGGGGTPGRLKIIRKAGKFAVQVDNNTTQYQEWRDGEMANDYYPYIWLVGTRANRNNLDRFYRFPVATGIDGAILTHTAAATTGKSAVFQWRNYKRADGAPDNVDELRTTATEVAAPRIASWEQSATGNLAAHGVRFAIDWKAPRNQVQEMAIDFWGIGDNAITTRITIRDVQLSERYREARDANAAAARERKLQRPIADKVLQ